MQRRSAADTTWLVVDGTIGLAVEAARAGGRISAGIARTVQPVTDLVARMPLLPERYRPARLLRGLATEGRRQRHRALRAARGAVRRSAPLAAADVLDQLDLTELIRDRVDLIGLARYVAAGLDHPETSPPPGAEPARRTRFPGVEADPRAVAEWVDRVFRTGRPATDDDT